MTTVKIDLSPLLIFSNSRQEIYLLDRQKNRQIFSYPAHNNTENPEGNPLITGSFSPAPFGFLALSPPDFITEEYRKSFYELYLGGSEPVIGESFVQEWGDFLEEEMGPVRFALGSPCAPVGFSDRAAWDRELLIHGARSFDTLTKGCIRMKNEDLVQLALQWILMFRKGFPLKSLMVIPD